MKKRNDNPIAGLTKLAPSSLPVRLLKHLDRIQPLLMEFVAISLFVRMNSYTVLHDIQALY